ncbi:hypothetical protein WMF45_45275 [Sorangium sp. So ce448]|uniref:hypothetical protein n=1 Tax=Sorangium sp. So ce448 TaxID=3133314 RepID=UPI003F5E6D99
MYNASNNTRRPMRDRILKKKEQQYALLREMYIDSEESDGARGFSLEDLDRFKGKLGLTERDFDSALQGLIDNGFVERIAAQFWELHPDGVREIEDTEAHPDEGSDYFEPSVINNVTNNFSGPVGAIQTGDHNTANVVQNLSGDVSGLLQQLREHISSLPADKQAEANELADGVEDQAKSPKRSAAMIKAALAGIVALFGGASKEIVMKIAAEIGTKLGPILAGQAGNLLGG